MAKPSISILLLFFILPPSYSNSSHTDFEALLSLKKSIREDPLHALSSWNETTHFCKWNGVSCSRRHPNRVVSVILQSRGLVGPLSPHIGNLSFLRTIDLQNNTFHGRIPQEIGRLKRLETIIFNNNYFQGEIPRNLTHCINLEELHLIDNKLTGEILPELGSLSKLKELRLSINLISGAIPPSLGNLTNLIKLSLAENSLQGEIPACLARMRRLQRLSLHENSLSGSVPLGLHNLSTMELLSLGTNRLHGSIPSSLASTLPKLNFLDLGYNHFTGELPPSLSNFSQIQRLRLSNNNFTGDLIDFARFSALEAFFASSNRLKGDVHTIFSSLTNCTRLRNFGLDGNLFTGSLPDSIGNLSTHLSSIWIYENRITGSIPSSIRNLVGLTFLNAEANSLRGPIPTSIGELDKLQEIFLGDNQLTGEMPSSFCNLTLLNHLHLEMNNLLGNIPRILGNCSNLLSLDLSYNSFNGTVPLEIMRLSSITIELDLSNNLLSGAIPSEVGDLRNCIFLGLSHNRLSGTIPTSLSSCVMLDFLGLGSNSLGGEIPENLVALRGLGDLDLSCNNFSGKIPRFLAEFHLLSLNLSFNALQGEVPTLGVFGNESAISLQGNRGLCGGSAFLNLPSCSSPNYSKKKLSLGKILIPTAAGAICLALASCFCIIVYRRRTLTKVANPGEIFVAPEFLRLSYADLFKATAGFLESNLVGAGRFGCVYRGNIINDDDERIVAVKVLNLDVRGAYKSLASECNALRGIRHRNLLKILSVCNTIDFQGNDFKALVYEFMANGSLEDWLHHHQNPHEQGSKIPLTFIQRLNIAIDVASAVEYLHCGTDSIVIHGDLKPSNILLDQDMVARVGDFGLAKIISSSSEGGSSSAAAIKGTIGYIPPEYGTSNVVSTQGDAYSYGILLLEMFTNIRPTSTDASLRDFVSSALPDHVMEVVDPFLHQQLNQGGGNKCWDCIVSILSIGVRCSMELPRDRMSMAEVVNDLKKIRTSVAPHQN